MKTIAQALKIGDNIKSSYFADIEAIFGHLGPFSAIFGQNSKLWLTGHVTTQNNRKTSRNPMEMVLAVTFQTFGPFLVILGPFWLFLANFGSDLKIVINWS